MVFIKDGDLYFQDGNNSPIQLTHGGEKADSLILSDDNKKIVFVRGNSAGDNYPNIYSVNTDGSQEQALITSQWLAALGEGTGVRSPVFVPGTHQLLFNTYLCETQDPNFLCSVGIFLVDADTGEVKKILAPGPVGQHDPLSTNFQVSPDGKMVSVATIGHIDILSVGGKVVRRDILPYTPSSPSYNFFSLFPVQFWLPDSSGLIVALPDTTNNIAAYGIVPAYSVWHYTIDTDAVVQIPLDPSLMVLYGCDKFQVSPDGKWILYGGNGDNASSLYVGNLGNGHTQLYDRQVCPYFSWSLDSKHFVYGNFLGSVAGSPVRIDGLAVGWVDASHYLFEEQNIHKIGIVEIVGDKILTYDLEPFSLIKPK